MPEDQLCCHGCRLEKEVQSFSQLLINLFCLLALQLVSGQQELQRAIPDNWNTFKIFFPKVGFERIQLFLLVFVASFLFEGTSVLIGYSFIYCGVNEIHFFLKHTKNHAALTLVTDI